MRELDYMLRAIDRRRHNDLAVQASFHGIKVPLKGEPRAIEQKNDVTEAEAMAMERARSEAKLRKAQELSRRYG